MWDIRLMDYTEEEGFEIYNRPIEEEKEEITTENTKN